MDTSDVLSSNKDRAELNSLHVMIFCQNMRMPSKGGQSLDI